MDNEFADRIKKLNLELLALKTASLYTSIRNTVTAFSGNVYTGVYRIDYDNNGENIISDVYTNKYRQVLGSVSLRTPQGSFQLVDVNTTYPDTSGGTGNPITYETSFVVVSNVPVTSITRIS